MRMCAATVRTVLLATVLLACGSSTPKRYVLERDLGAFVFRRYQKTLDIEFALADNPATGHTATYVLRDESTSQKRVPHATAFVSVYRRPKGLAESVRTRLLSLGTYEVSVKELSGHHVWWLDGGSDHWAVWVSGKHVVKLGAPLGDTSVPDPLVQAYTDAYPSDLNEYGRPVDGSASAGIGDSEAGVAKPKREGTGRAKDHQ